VSTIVSNNGQPSYLLKNDRVTIHVTVQGGHMTAVFDESVSPFFTAPWWNEADIGGDDQITRVLRGDFFCLPFGANTEPYDGIKHPVHGKTANDCWDCVGLDDRSPDKTLRLKMGLGADRGSVEKVIGLRDREPLIYSEHIVTEFEGESSVGHHAILQCPQDLGAGIIDMSEPVTGFTTPTPIEDSAMGGYCLLQAGQEISDRTKVSCCDGSLADLTRYPTKKGYEDVVIFMSDISKPFTFTAASFPDQGHLYFQLKDPRVLPQTLFWLSNGGRHYAPWSGRLSGVLGMEEIAGFFHYGVKESVEPNFLQERGFKSFAEFKKTHPSSIKVIMGVVPIASDFEGVQDIIRSGDSEITILGKGGQRISVSCNMDFLGEFDSQA
jgi:hypothetical protein